MFFDPRSILLFFCNALLLYLMLLVDSTLGAWSLHLFLLGPMLVIPALYLKHTGCFVSLLLSGLWVDAALPATFGLFTYLFLFIGTAIYCMRHRFRAEHNYHPILLAHGCNAICLIALSLIEGSAHLGMFAYWQQILLTAFISHSALLIVAPWFFNLERLLFRIFHLETEPEDLPIT